MIDDVHVVPVGDYFLHADSDECMCGPSIAVVNRDDGSIGQVIVHHSLDGRELKEPHA